MHNRVGETVMTMRFRRTLQALAGVAILGAVSAAGDRGPDACTSTVAVDTSTWRRIDTGVFTMRLPRAYRGIRMRGVDSAVEGWNAGGGRRVRSDYGWTQYVGGPFSDTDVVCERGPRDSWRIAAYEYRGRLGVGYHGLDPSRDDRALMVMAESPRREDIPELFAIIRSVRWAGRPPLAGRPASR
jgi:hypothetical protein